jgi:predicted nucleic acid-binding protein
VNIIVDTNIVFSAIINANGKIGDLLFNSPENYRFYSPEFMKEEVNRYSDKLLKASKLNKTELLVSQDNIFSKIDLISEEVISNNTWRKAFLLTKNIDQDDTPFVALTLEIDGILWTGDKKLISGLKLKDFNSILSTNELHILRGY